MFRVFLVWLTLFSFVPRAHANSFVLPVACHENISSYTGPELKKAKSCAALFGDCGKLGSNVTPPSSSQPGEVWDAIDQVIQALVEDEIHNLYLGFTVDPTTLDPGPPPLNTRNWLRGTDILDSSTAQGYGPCAHSGACNPFCGEGSPADGTFATFAIDSAKTALGPARKAQHGYVVDSTDQNPPRNAPEPFFTGLQTYVSQPGVKAVDFYAKGVIEQGQKLPVSTDTIPVAKYTPGPSEGPEGWPSQSFKSHIDKDMNGTAASCVSDIWTKQPMSNLVSYHTVITDEMGLKKYKFTNLTWNDGSWRSGGTEQCHITYVADYSKASTIAALQTGALVQAYWMALDEVYQELKTSGHITIQNAQCQGRAKNYLELVEQTSNRIFDVTHSCTDSLDSIKQSCDASTAPGGPGQIAGCETLSALLTLHTSNFVDVVRCEISTRARKRIEEAMASSRGRQWVRQIKSWSTAACMQASGKLFNDLEGFPQLGDTMPSGSACNGIYAACIALNAYPIVGPVLSAACFLGVYLSIGDADKCHTSDRSFDSVVKAAYSAEKMGKCLPYAYSSAFKTYLEDLGFKKTDLQKIGYRSKRSAEGGTQPLYEINGCQLTDRVKRPADRPFPRKRPTSSILPSLIPKPVPGLPHRGSFFGSTVMLTWTLEKFFIHEASADKFTYYKKKGSDEKAEIEMTNGTLFSLDQIDDEDVKKAITEDDRNKALKIYIEMMGTRQERRRSETLTPEEIRMNGDVQNYCSNPDGILLVGKQAVPGGCCTYPEPGPSTSVEGNPNLAAAGVPCPNGAAEPQGPPLTGENTKLTNVNAGNAQAEFSRNAEASPSSTPRPEAFLAAQTTNSQSAASGDEKVANPATKPTPPASLLGDLGSFLKGLSGKGFGAPSGSGSGGGGSTVGTSPHAAESAAPSLLGSESTGNYASGGGGLAATAGGQGPESRGLSLAPREQGNIDFGARGSSSAGGSSDTLAIDDPENYFTRIDLKQSLFELIHQRYLIKTPQLMGWASAK